MFRKVKCFRKICLHINLFPNNFAFTKCESKQPAPSKDMTAAKLPTAIDCAAGQAGKGCCQWLVVSSQLPVVLTRKKRRTKTLNPTNKGDEPILNPHKQRRRTKSPPLTKWNVKSHKSNQTPLQPTNHIPKPRCKAGKRG